jgi:hypothetical protein
MSLNPEELLVREIDYAVVPIGFRQITPLPSVEAVQLTAAWRQGWPRLGIAIVSIGKYADHPGGFAKKLRVRIGKKIGYIPLLTPLGLHVVVTGRGMLSRTDELQLYLDTVSRLTVTLQSIYVVDLDAREYIANLPPMQERFEEQLRPLAQQNLESLERVKQIKSLGISGGPRNEPMQMRFDYSHRTGRAVKTARTWGRDITLTPSADAIESEIERFVHSQE